MVSIMKIKYLFINTEQILHTSDSSKKKILQ